MNNPPDKSPQPGSFEFDSLRNAHRYRAAVLNEFAPYLHGRVLEVGAGIGQFTAMLIGRPGINELVAVEPNPDFCRVLRETCPGVAVHVGTARTLPPGPTWDAIVSINVLEHIPDDEAELKTYASILRAGRGRLCLFVPAGREIYAPIDRDFGHYRRYGRAELREKLARAGFAIDSLHYFNGIGYLLWWLNFCVLRRRRFGVLSVRCFDRLVLPVVHAIETRITRPPVGQSLVAIACPKEACSRE